VIERLADGNAGRPLFLETLGFCRSYFHSGSGSDFISESSPTGKRDCWLTAGLVFSWEMWDGPATASIPSICDMNEVAGDELLLFNALTTLWWSSFAAFLSVSGSAAVVKLELASAAEWLLGG